MVEFQLQEKSWDLNKEILPSLKLKSLFGKTLPCSYSSILFLDSNILWNYSPQSGVFKLLGTCK